MSSTNTDAVVIGRCSLVVDEKAETICNTPAVNEVLVRNVFGLYSTHLCAEHFKKHWQFYAERRRTKPGKKHTERSSNQGEAHYNEDDQRQAFVHQLPVAS